MSWFENLFGNKTEIAQKKSPSFLADVQKAFNGVEEKTSQYAACLALITARVAGADTVISEGETKRMIEVLLKHTDLSDSQAAAAVEIASSQELNNSIQHNRVTEALNSIATEEQKQEIIHSLFYVACDDDISELESEKIRSISAALFISNDQYIMMRSKYSEYRSILKGIPTS